MNRSCQNLSLGLVVVTLLVGAGRAHAEPVETSARLAVGLGQGFRPHTSAIDLFELAPRFDVTVPLGTTLRLGAGLELRTVNLDTFAALAGPSAVLSGPGDFGLTFSAGVGGGTRFKDQPPGVLGGVSVALGIRRVVGGFAATTMIYVSAHRSLGSDLTQWTAGLELGGGVEVICLGAIHWSGHIG